MYQKQIIHEWCLDGGCLTVWYHLTAKRRIQQNQSTSRDYQVITIAMYLLLGKQIGLLSSNLVLVCMLSLPPCYFFVPPSVCRSREAQRHGGSGRIWRSGCPCQRTYNCAVSPGRRLIAQKMIVLRIYEQSSHSRILHRKLTVARNDVNFHVNIYKFFKYLQKKHI